jgi:hypothetical protein
MQGGTIIAFSEEGRSSFGFYRFYMNPQEIGTDTDPETST